MKLVRSLETFGRRSALYDRVDRASYLALRTLERLGPTSPGDLAYALRLDASTVTRQVATLISGGFVRRRPHSADRRSSTLAITPEGHIAMHEVERERRRQIRMLVANWDQQEQDDLARILVKFNDSLVDAFGSGRPETPG